MRPWQLWVSAAVLGAATTVLTSLGLIVFLAFVVLAIRFSCVAVRPPTSGWLTGFGALWLLLMARQFSSGGRLDNAEFWIAVGAVPLIIGSGLLVWMLRTAVRGNAPGYR